MATGITKASTVDAIINTIIAEARYTMVHRAVMPSLVRTYKLPKGSDTITLPKFGTVTVASLTDGVDMASPQSVTPTTSLTLTAGEVGCQVVLTDKAVRNASEDMNRAVGRLQGEAMAKKVDQDLLGNFSSFTTHSLGSSSVPGTPGLISAAYFRLLGQTEPAPEPFALVLHPYTSKDLTDTITQLAAVSSNYTWHGAMAGELSQKVFTAGFRGVDKLFGVPVYQSGNISTTSGSLNAMFSKEAICYLSDVQPKTEKERDASLRAWEINYVSSYGYGLYQESFGVLITCDATAPTT